MVRALPCLALVSTVVAAVVSVSPLRYGTTVVKANSRHYSSLVGLLFVCMVKEWKERVFRQMKNSGTVRSFAMA